MADDKLSTVKEVFPDPPKTAKLEDKEKKTNLSHMFQLSDEKKKKVVQYLKDCVDECKKQRQEWMNIRYDSIKNYEGIRKPSGPWDGSSNVTTMITTISVDMIHSKLFPMVWNPDLIYWKGTTSHNEEVAENNRVYAQWIFTKDMPDTQDNVDEITGRLVLDGTIAVKIRWEKNFVYVTRAIPKSFNDKGEIQYDIVYDKVKRERAIWDIKEIEHVYFPYNCKNEDDAEYIIDEIYYTLPMLREMKEKKLILPDIDIEDIQKALQKKYDPEGGQKARLEAAGIETINDRLESIPICCYEGYVKYDIDDDNMREECVFLVLPDIDIYLSGKALHCISRIGKRPWKLGQFLKRPGCSLGKGIPELVRNLHNELDAIHNQRIDAGNMVIAPPFGYRAASGFDPKTISVRPATGIPLDDPERDLKFFDINPSRLSVSFQEENIIMDLISKLTYLPPSAFGKESASRPTARGTIALIAESGQPFNLLAGRVMKIVLDLLSDTRKMYEEHFDNTVAKMILDDKGRQRWAALSPEMIAGDYMAFSTVDLEKSNTAFEAQANQVMYQTLVANPLVQQNPSFFWELTANFIRSLGKKNVEKFIGPQPDYENNPGIVDDENQMFMQEQNVQVNPKDDDVAHINGHSKFKKEMFGVLTQEALRRLSVHILEHRYAYTQKLQQSAMAYGGMSEGGGQGGGLASPGMSTIQGPPVQSQTPQLGQATGTTQGGGQPSGGGSAY